MKLIFPNGEHGAVLLSAGRNRLGSSEQALIRLQSAGIQPEHCELELAGSTATVRLGSSHGVVTANGQPVADGHVLHPGDAFAVAGVACRLVAVERAAAVSTPKPAQIDDSGATRVRAALPKYVLRGVSGATFGKTFPVVAPTVIGRQHDCDIAIASEEISRRHAQVKPTPDGLLVEDLGSSNGTYINGSRVQSGLLKAGDELRLDAVRFMLVVPGKEIPNTNAHAPSTTSAPAQVRQGNAGMITGIIISALAIAAATYWFALR